MPGSDVLEPARATNTGVSLKNALIGGGGLALLASGHFAQAVPIPLKLRPWSRVRLYPKRNTAKYTKMPRESLNIWLNIWMKSQMFLLILSALHRSGEGAEGVEEGVDAPLAAPSGAALISKIWLAQKQMKGFGVRRSLAEGAIAVEGEEAEELEEGPDVAVFDGRVDILWRWVKGDMRSG
ncbi:hypothetical protein BJX68DRAFT_270163 [Aspergillus pseudodeflectus]|uniref:Uncharacterized protein n=1 Tax=Aspergillus pseudodeflectus TaxID=176178 RepID=A0ABR4JUC5_9EURO